MKRNSCYIRQNRNLLNLRVFPWVMETYPIDKNNKFLHRRDFECKNIGECFRIAHAVYDDFVMSYSGAAQRSYNKRWKGTS